MIQLEVQKHHIRQLRLMLLKTIGIILNQQKKLIKKLKMTVGIVLSTLIENKVEIIKQQILHPNLQKIMKLLKSLEELNQYRLLNILAIIKL